MRGKVSRSSRLRRVGLAACSIVLALVALEVGIWVAYAVVGGKPRILRSDPELGWSNRRNYDGSRRLGDGSTWAVALDERGYRTLGLPTLPGAPDIVALGDSFVFGDGVDAGAHFLREVGRRLPANVTNLGVVGYSTDQEWLAFRRFEGECDVVLLGTYLTNDLSGNLSHSGGHLLRFKPKAVGFGDEMVLAPLAHPWLNAARHRSYLVTLALRASRSLAPGLLPFDTPPVTDESAGAGPAWERYVDLVDRIVDEAERRGATRVLILLWSDRSSQGDPHAAELLDARYRGRGVRVIDVDRRIAQRGLDPRALYHPPAVDPGAHWNAAGHAFVAEAVLEALDDVP